MAPFQALSIVPAAARTAFAAVAVLLCTVSFAQEAGYRDSLRVAAEQLRYGGDSSFGGVDLTAAGFVAEFYERRSFRPAWQDERKVDSLIVAIESAADDGLDPADYHLHQIVEQNPRFRDVREMVPTERAAFELILTDALISLVYHQRYGKVDPLDHDSIWNFRGPDDGSGMPELVERALNAPLPREFIVDEIPRGAFYDRLRTTLATYREIASDGGWPVIDDGPTLKPGATDGRMERLAARLAVTGDLGDAKPYATATMMDTGLEQAVRRFQSRHGLQADGVVGPATLRALNVPVEQRIEQLRLTMERARWVLGELEVDFVVVNIAGFRAYVVLDGEMAWETRVVVGKAQQQTPVFRDRLQYVVFNPTWTVPYSIATRELLPAIKADPAWFNTHNFEVKDGVGGHVDPSSVDWSTVTSRGFPYTFVQRAGPDNALGRVKFVFPNEHAVYLHDTPARELFGTPERAFSHGCIRVEDPLEFAKLLLGPEGWDRGRIDAVVASGRTTTAFLKKPLPVLLLYWTASVDPDGLVHFYRDVYQRDPPIARALDAPFRIQPVRQSL